MSLLEQIAVEAVNISKVYWDGSRRLEILKNVFFSVKKGDTVAILGPSGSGKTTLLNLLAGLDSPNEGSVHLAGVELTSLDENAKAQLRNRHVGFVFQFYHLLPEFTALENVMLPAIVSSGTRAWKSLRDKAASLLEKVGLGDRLAHFSSELSGGERQRVAIARALMNEPEILFCDEPTGNLDPETAAQIIGIFKHFLIEKKKTVLMVTHDLQIARMATKVWNIVKNDWEKE
jgi:ABC-type lipoprotein export system ATPase subunit